MVQNVIMPAASANAPVDGKVLIVVREVVRMTNTVKSAVRLVNVKQIIRSFVILPMANVYASRDGVHLRAIDLVLLESLAKTVQIHVTAGTMQIAILLMERASAQLDSVVRNVRTTVLMEPMVRTVRFGATVRMAQIVRLRRDNVSVRLDGEDSCAIVLVNRIVMVKIVPKPATVQTWVNAITSPANVTARLDSGKILIGLLFIQKSKFLNLFIELKFQR